MSEETTVTNPSEEDQGNTIPAFSVVSAQPPLTSHEIERICKAFIRLINAKENNHHDQPADQ